MGGLARAGWDTAPARHNAFVAEQSGQCARLHPRQGGDGGDPAEGEASQWPTSAAQANALFDATGARLRELPLPPRRLAAALQTR
ncbi:hypothetical protein [Myxococcus xanthus]|uniref:Uncharacterized protein n=1 Tax=Myxococcus xanthus TaxID=34 RepID=A0A7Y4MUA2_MYXXA|nr:hypothetical protein [Myxococcus xanthus]NOJ81403.1 hypothetical protein [Myxococcus xanthus]NOJ88686.1 hypothetical protein [Myxococcus xanthus]